MEKKKKRLIILSVIAGVLLAVILLSSAIFKIKSASIEYQTTLTMLTAEDLNDMVEEVNLPYGKSIFFTSLEDEISAMEKSRPYVKINGIERTFPNSLVILASERVPVVRLLCGNDDYILDSDLKVLNIVKDQNPSEYNSATGEWDLPTLTISDHFNFTVGSATEGDFLSNDQIQGYVDAFYRGAVTQSTENPDIAVSLISTIASINIGYSEELEKIEFTIKYTGSSLESTIIGDNDLVDCIYKIVKTVNQSLVTGEEYEYVNCTDGVFYAKKK